MRLHMRYPGGCYKAVTFSFDDGVQQDMRFLELLKKYDMKGTFNLNSGRFITRDHTYPEGTVWRAMVDEDVVPTYSDPHAGVACHTVSHPTLTRCTEAEMAYQMLEDRRRLERLFGRLITGLAIPNGPYDDTVVRVAKACGITYMRTVRPTHDFQFPQELCPFDPTCSYNDPALEEIIPRFLAAPCQKEPYLLYIWGHTYSFEELGHWDKIEGILRSLAHQEGVWYATDAEIFDYASKFEMLEWSDDGHAVYNPTDTPLYMGNGGPNRWSKRPETVRCVAPGETLYY
ncbi:MAG: hypothetical protein E7541_05815 [Ruminococcaceae bacterium]|nr:hypothetical protein [Oscillospiraceae bacterium]